ncbi:high mobility group protein B3-like [Montipora foliosa]|uniref:high mobility group protein B3-like n=1 Tax=Montipora foliosa TaxID=591990 RepID=UPI0035F19A52
MPRSGKDPNKPKGRRNPYSIFLQQEREAMKKLELDANKATEDESPANFLEFSKACAEKWKALSEEERQPYREAAEKDKLRYENEMANYSPPEAAGRKTRKGKKPKDKNRPKGAKNPFMCFSEEKRPKLKEQNPDEPTKEIAKMLGEMWRNMNDQDKEHYIKLAQRDKERYDEEMKAFMKGDYVVPSTSVDTDMVEAEE